MAPEPIIRLTFPEPDRAALQEALIKRVEDNPDEILKKYEQHPDSHSGRYVNSDLMKEMFPEYAESKETRARYNAVVQRSAAVLTAEQWKRVMADPTREGDKALFLTGIPGAGKTSLIKNKEGGLPSDAKAVYEGQLADAEFAIPKVQAALDAGLKPVIVAVHTPPERALENTFTRFNEKGRGAGINNMAHIQGNLPTGLAAIRERFGDKVSLRVVDKTDEKQVKRKEGWEHLSMLQKEGDYGQIRQRLSDYLEHAYKAGSISDACYDQACGRPPRDRQMARQGDSERQQDGRGRGIQKGSSENGLVIKNGGDRER